MRFWAGAAGQPRPEHQGRPMHDRVRRHALVPRAGAPRREPRLHRSHRHLGVRLHPCRDDCTRGPLQRARLPAPAAADHRRARHPLRGGPQVDRKRQGVRVCQDAAHQARPRVVRGLPERAPRRPRPPRPYARVEPCQALHDGGGADLELPHKAARGQARGAGALFVWLRQARQEAVRAARARLAGDVPLPARMRKGVDARRGAPAADSSRLDGGGGGPRGGEGGDSQGGGLPLAASVRGQPGVAVPTQAGRPRRRRRAKAKGAQGALGHCRGRRLPAASVRPVHARLAAARAARCRMSVCVVMTLSLSSLSLFSTSPSGGRVELCELDCARGLLGRFSLLACCCSWSCLRYVYLRERNRER
mmetsp:Transcript_10237/g.32368  ORF Transcript_10237/g.32368 Transcript_10237/m.32368 type:complete len:362 (+) Transcript_10237:587-1672(+)